MRRNQNPGNLPKISIITPTLNQGKYISCTIESVLSQNYPNLEFIVMDGGSNDNTIKVLKKYEKNLVWYSKKDKGQSDAINKGIIISKGEIISYLNSDDLLLKGSLLLIGKYFSNNPGFDWVTGKCIIIDDKGKETDKIITGYKNFWLKYIRNKFSLGILNYISQPATFWKRQVIEKIGLFDRTLFYAMDYDYWLRICKIYPMGFMDRNIAAFRIYSDSKSGKNFNGLFNEGYRVCEKYNNRTTSILHKIHDLAILNSYKILRKL